SLRFRNHERAAAATEAMLLPPPSVPRWFLNAGRFLSACAVFAGRDTALQPAARMARADAYADRAVALLRQAVALGYANAEELRPDDYFEPLRPRADFRELIATLETRPRK